MPRQSKRTSAPAPMEMPPPSPGAQRVPPATAPSMFGPGVWCPPCPQSMASPSVPHWIPGLQHPGMPGSSSQGRWLTPPSSTNMEDSDMHVWGVDSNPPGGLLNFLNKNTLKHVPAQAVNNGISSQPINVGDDDNGSDCPRTEKRMLWTKDEHITLDQFGRIKKRVQWFCGSWKEANALWASGESDADLMDKALKLYEEQHKKDGPFMFKHCWDVLRKEPKWDAYLERLANLDPEKRKFNVEDEVAQHFSLDDDKEERPMGGKKAKELKKRKRNDEAIIDLEDELQLFVDAQNKASEGRKEMLEIQKRVSSENLEARKLAYLAAKESKESAMLQTYQELLKQDTTIMAEDVRSEHVLALRCFREKLFGNTN
ncbi:unnamed protein product [Urochloa decumbens]|uniref:No apical meristem-associated C-terminal domain-containing protein n=1 Tax=Urochloa decumbens TaxID=240449 RepID=A0ABC9EAL8_9POAL